MPKMHLSNDPGSDAARDRARIAALEALLSEIVAYIGREHPSVTNYFAEPTGVGTSIHAAVMSVEGFYGGRLHFGESRRDRRAIKAWKHLRRLSDDDGEEAYDEAQELRDRVAEELERLRCVLTESETDVRCPGVDGRKDTAPAYVTLEEAASICHTPKKTLETWKAKGKLPTPAVEHSGRRPARWKWDDLRPSLEELTRMQLPQCLIQ